MAGGAGAAGSRCAKHTSHGGSRKGDGQISTSFFTYAERGGKNQSSQQSWSAAGHFPVDNPSCYCCLSRIVHRKLKDYKKMWRALKHTIQNRAKTDFCLASDASIPSALTDFSQTSIICLTLQLSPISFNAFSFCWVTTGQVGETRQLNNIVCESQPLSPNGP